MPDAPPTNIAGPGKIVLIYIVVACLWILLSDRILILAGAETSQRSFYQTAKGLLFVFATGWALYILIRRKVRSVSAIEAAREQASQRYTELIENANDVIYTLGLKGQITSINRSGEKIIGYPREELLNLNLADIAAPGCRQAVKRHSSTATEKNPVVFEAEFTRKDGEKVLLEVSSRPMYEDHEIVGTQGIARDITERRTVEENYRETEARYRDLITTANEGIVIVDEDGRITFVNQAMCEMLDYDSEELMENFIFDFMDEDAAATARQKIEHQKTGFQERFDLKFRRLDGVDLWTRVSASPVLSDGKYIGSLGMVTDISDRKAAEDALLQEKYIGDSIIDSLPGVFYLYDKAGKFLRWNKNFEKVTGYSAGEMQDRHPLDFFAGEEKILLEQKIKEVFEKGEETVEANFVAKDGTRTPYFFTGKKITIGEMEYLVGMGIDISERV